MSSRIIRVLIIFVLINFSHEFNTKTNSLNRHIRSPLLKSDTQAILNDILADDKQLEDETKAEIEKNQESIRTISQTVLMAADRMAEAGSTNTASVQEWQNIRQELRKGISIVIGAYQRFIRLHRKSCEDIEDFAKTMITKYEAELAKIDDMPVPDILNSSTDTRSPEWAKYLNKFMNIFIYARAHQITLPAATDCTSDLMMRTLWHRAAILNQSPAITRTIHIRFDQPMNAQYGSQTVSIPCSNSYGDNGYQSCTNAIANITQSYASAITD